ncbi:MAG: superoxide dismutase [Candidatus Dormibacteraeota bacterium]|uniref:Superoxide dismutase n=1 Tax=Candidatus Dormiibacter inghamiae TaxID=3127013 RepID=A0A934KKB0_9BACT|nr:superoxide dismutase [Candidatus Dormibacteraeota bacterium]MBJ7604815.1 superoxide dismutase [Candidatus Dormibacteraeota bacterium]
MAFELPPIPYALDTLEPHIDAQTMQIHHDKHHATYVNNLNGAIEKHPELAQKSIEELLADLNAIPDDIRTVVRNNGGGHFNHSIFWTIMGPNAGGQPQGAAADAISQAFGDFASFKDVVTKAAVGQFGSGWSWAYLSGGKLQVKGFPNQDNPVSEGGVPILGVDVWEHAYYLNYQNRRPDYVAAWWNTVNWQAVNERLSAAR